MLSIGQIAAKEKELEEFLIKHYETPIKGATNRELFFSLAQIARDKILNKRLSQKAQMNEEKKVVHYMSIEFLIGKSLKNNLWNLGLLETYRTILEKYNIDIGEVFKVEKDAGLGNGGLGRLAACFLDSLATLDYQAVGHSILYEYGLFQQKIVEGKQVEFPDKWLEEGDVWLEKRDDEAVIVELGGSVREIFENNKLYFKNENAVKIKAIPYDMPICGYKSYTVGKLRLWKAVATNGFDIKQFSNGNFDLASANEIEIDAINRVLYPADNNDKGKRLRLIQQYFLVSAAMQNILSEYFRSHKTIKGLSTLVSVHINDTHPALCIPELIRLLIDIYGFGWDEVWDEVKKVVSYTNHTVLSEALEVKKLSIIEQLMPRVASILKELDRRFRITLREAYPNDIRIQEQMAIISGGQVFMANLSLYGSHMVNGVAKIHSNILKNGLFKNFANIYPNSITNITNGVTHRRWLAMSNHRLDKLITSLIGDKYYKCPQELEKLAKFADNDKVLKEIYNIKLENKKRFAKYLKETQGIDIDPMARFDVLVKRIHEYKRQLMNALKIIYLCEQIKKNPEQKVTPQVFIFSGKAASGYYMAKRIIKLINELAFEIDNNPIFEGKIKVVFVENYSVTVSELLMPATDVSEQISLAGREASGTGNMKAVLNGALMLCTTDGANIEIMEKCGKENHFEFGLKAEQIEEIKNRGMNPVDYYYNDEIAKTVIDKLKIGVGRECFADIADYLLGRSDNRDHYMCLADLRSYIAAHYEMDKAYANKKEWSKKCLHSISRMGYFSSDRAIGEYAQKIWKLTK